MNVDNPILNSPYQEPQFHYDTDKDGNLNYHVVCHGRRIFKDDTAVLPNKQSQGQIFSWNDDAENYSKHPINLIRNEIKQWRQNEYPNTTRVTRELLLFWFNNPDRALDQRLFFAQQEAVETAIWLNEVADKTNAGQNILQQLRDAQQSVSDHAQDYLPRIAFKMATGTGKTVVMGCLICYHYFNRLEYRNDTRFADCFLIITPSVTIRDRLGVLRVDSTKKNIQTATDYYHQRGLIPPKFSQYVDGINHLLVITNYHTFEPKTLQGNKKSPFDGKVDINGNKVQTNNKEDFGQVVKRLLSQFKRNSRLLILNDEAHHCYLPKSKSKTGDTGADENARAAVWFTGLRELAKRFRLQNVYDLSATPYYLSGSGYTAYSLFPWVVSNFGLIEAIEAGLVKIPFLPESDNTNAIEMPRLRDIYRHVLEVDPNAFPKKGQKTKTTDNKDKNKEEAPQLPALVQNALDQFYNHYLNYEKGLREQAAANKNLLTRPPVFIIVCNNTALSKEVYKYIAGYEYENDLGERITIAGKKEVFSNYDLATARPLKKPPTLLIDSEALEDGGQINDDFKRIFKSEIEEFKRDYARLKGSGDNITDSEILREVVNTVGQPNKLGGHIRCVVSVSMLTEGWDANTVTHIMGLRAFGSQLLCEQVAGRALRRMSYQTEIYSKITGQIIPKKERHKYKPENLVEKFPPEYAHIIGIPFKVFKGGQTVIPPPPKDRTYISAVPEREQDYEITFPNVIGYRIEHKDKIIRYDFSEVEPLEIRGDILPTKTTLKSAFASTEIEITLQSVLEKREAEIIYWITHQLIKYKYSDENGKNSMFHKFNQLKKIVQIWYNEKIKLINLTDPKYKKLILYENPKNIVERIFLGIKPDADPLKYVRPVFNYYNPFGSTKEVNGNTSKDVYKTTKSHVNYVVKDSDWEETAAKYLEEMELVLCYVKNQYLNFYIPYINEHGHDKKYFPDFIAKVQTPEGEIKNLIIEISGTRFEKTEKTQYVLTRWLPAVNALRHKYNYAEWHFIEIVGDEIRDFKNQILRKILSL